MREREASFTTHKEPQFHSEQIPKASRSCLTTSWQSTLGRTFAERERSCTSTALTLPSLNTITRLALLSDNDRFPVSYFRRRVRVQSVKMLSRNLLHASLRARSLLLLAARAARGELLGLLFFRNLKSRGELGIAKHGRDAPAVHRRAGAR